MLKMWKSRKSMVVQAFLPCKCRILPVQKSGKALPLFHKDLAVKKLVEKQCLSVENLSTFDQTNDFVQLRFKGRLYHPSLFNSIDRAHNGRVIATKNLSDGRK